jgi:hypothetical protein
MSKEPDTLALGRSTADVGGHAATRTRARLVAPIDKARSVALRSRTQPTRKILMPDRESDFPDRSHRRRMALSRWESEGGALCGHLGAAAVSRQSNVPSLTNAELVQLQIRVIALENLVIALLTDVPDKQLDLVRAMAAYISPRPGFTPHRLTIHAATEMISLVERASHFRAMPPA